MKHLPSGPFSLSLSSPFVHPKLWIDYESISKCICFNLPLATLAASRKAAGPDEVPAELFKAGEEIVLDRMTEYVWRSGKLVSGHRNGRSPRSSLFPSKVILNSV